MQPTWKVHPLRIWRVRQDLVQPLAPLGRRVRRVHCSHTLPLQCGRLCDRRQARRGFPPVIHVRMDNGVGRFQAGVVLAAVPPIVAVVEPGVRLGWSPLAREVPRTPMSIQ
jgi:hypothetical protein